MNGISDDTSKINTYVGDDGLIHFTNKDGADTVLNFSKGTDVLIIPFSFTFVKTSDITITVNYGKTFNSVPDVALQLLTVAGSSVTSAYPCIKLWNPFTITTSSFSFTGSYQHASGTKATYTAKLWVIGN